MSIRKNNVANSGGFIHIAILVVIALGIGGVAYWRLSSYNNNSASNSTSGATNTATLSEECVAKTGDANICRLGAIADLSQFSSVVRMTMTNENGSLTSVVKYDGKGNSETEVGEDIRGITVGGKDYILLDGKWYEAGGSGSPQPPKASLPSFGFATTAGIKYENLGKQPCGNATCFKYRMSGGILGDGVVIALFGDKDYLPRSIDSTGGLLGKLTMTVEYKDVIVSAPSGALPMSSLFEGMGTE